MSSSCCGPHWRTLSGLRSSCVRCCDRHLQTRFIRHIKPTLDVCCPPAPGNAHAGNVCGLLCIFFIGWNLTKLPDYWPYGAPGGNATATTDANHVAVTSDPSLFLAPHIAMGVCLLGKPTLIEP